MSEQRAMLAATVDRLFEELMADGMPEVEDLSTSPLWQSIEDLGLTEVFLPESKGGFGGCWQDAFVVFHLLGLHALPLPVGETLIAKKLLQEAAITSPAGTISLGNCTEAVLSGDGANRLFSGRLSGVPWGGVVQHIVIACRADEQDQLLLLENAQGFLQNRHRNEADEPRDDMVFQNAVVSDVQLLSGSKDKALLYSALLRSAQISGALEGSLKATVKYVNQREQFGRPLSKFQAVQHQLALLAEEASAVKCAAMAASRSQDHDTAEFEIAAAKRRANRAVGIATSIVHQAHGAIGFTREHHLHYWTQRLWSWRSEFGNDRYWSNRLGRLVLTEGPDKFWENLTARGDV